MQLVLKNVTKTYTNGIRALDAVNLEIQPGMFGLLGPNGAGKSTLMRTLATLQKPDSGELRFGALDILKNPMALRQKLGYLPQTFGVYPGLSARYLLRYFARLKGLPPGRALNGKIDGLLELTNLYEERNRHVDRFSGGMKQRFGIAQMLLNDPDLIIVDEPTAGLDPEERNRFLNILREVAATKTILFSTHIVDDIKDLCNALAIMNNGRVLVRTTVDEALLQMDGMLWSREVSLAEAETVTLNISVISRRVNRHNKMNIRAISASQPAAGFTQTTATLEDYYFAVLKHDKRVLDGAS
jgi:ABC-2 type transport system ATP-binding protein